VLTRGLCLAALAALITASAGCGGVGSSGAAEPLGNQLAIYSSLPLQGPRAAVARQIIGGEKLALAQTHGRIGPFTISYASLDDADPASGRLDPGATATDAKIAAQDTSTIAYIGDLDSAATAVSLPLINAAGILQLSPASPYVGLTSALRAGQDEPARFYPSGLRTFARLQRGDPSEALVQGQLMRSLGVRRLFVLSDQDPFQAPLAQLVAAEAQKAGIAVAGRDSINAASGSRFTGAVEKIARSGAGAVFYAGGEGGTAAVALWRELHAANPRLLLFGSSVLANDAFAQRIGAAGSTTYITTPVLALDRYPPAAARVLRDYRRAFGVPGDAYALYGYEAMSLVLESIRRAGAHGNDRRAVIAALFGTRERASVLGRFSVQPGGEVTLPLYGVDRIENGRLVFFRAMPAR
jgi:branched-chain amino acid transport system substrate-binding protein